MGNRIHESQRDPLTGYPVFTSNDHTYIHQGKGFSLVAITTATDIDVDFLFYEESGY